MNKLKKEKSPYLLQHAENPINWHPWEDEAFEKAKRDDKPIFLSIGYSTCHWCHVMAHESFEDEEVAELLNKNFVSIKVDREERPDIDNIYMTACQLMTGNGGWPLTIIMTPEKEPFFAATYIPKRGRGDRMGLLELLPKVVDLWQFQRGHLLKSVNQIKNAIEKYSQILPGKELDESVLDFAFRRLSNDFDEKYGGFGEAPKFPTPHNLLFLLRYWKRTEYPSALEIVEKTLEKMRKGGIYDHLGFGFHRYSTDEKWLIPHFEKMLYDQAMLALAYLDAFQITKKEIFADTAREIFAYVMGNMTDEQGGFYSAEDADSEGIEGKFYIWKEEEIREALGERSEEIIDYFNVKSEGNFIEPMTGNLSGENILHITEELKNFQEERKKLFEYRERRTKPYKDDKILTNWNGLMLAAFAKGAQILGDEKFAQSAEKAMAFLLEKMVTDGKLLHRFRDGEAAITGQLEDYAFLTFGLIELYEATFQIKYLKKAVELTRVQIEFFWDKENGGFYSVAKNSEKLLVRKKEFFDSAIPSGNSISLHNLLRLARLTGNQEFEEKAQSLAKAFSNLVKKAPTSCTQLLSGVDFMLSPSTEVVIIGKEGSEDTQKMIKKLNQKFNPNMVILFVSEKKKEEVEKIAGFIKNYKSINGKATAYVCQNFNCELPTTDIEKMMDLIK